MERLITVKDVMTRYGCTGATARKYIRQCKPHMENPCTTSEIAFREWEASRTVVEPRQRTKMLKKLSIERVIVPRRR